MSALTWPKTRKIAFVRAPRYSEVIFSISMPSETHQKLLALCHRVSLKKVTVVRQILDAYLTSQEAGR